MTMPSSADVIEEHRTHIQPWPSDAGHPPLAGRVSCFAIRDGQVAAIYDIVNPDKLGRTFSL